MPTPNLVADPNVHQVLTISYGHVSFEEQAAIKDQATNEGYDGIPIAAVGPYTALLYIEGSLLEGDAADLYGPANCPALYQLLRHAHQLGCTYLVLDRDAPVLEDFATFDW